MLVSTECLQMKFFQKAKDEEIEKSLETALEAGYRHIDTAFVYENEAVIGKVLNRWLSSGKIQRNTHKTHKSLQNKKKINYR